MDGCVEKCCGCRDVIKRFRCYSFSVISSAEYKYLTDILQVEVIGVLLLSCRAFEELFRNLGKKHHILGAFEKLRKATIDFVMSVHPHRTSRLTLEDFFFYKI